MSVRWMTMKRQRLFCMPMYWIRSRGRLSVPSGIERRDLPLPLPFGRQKRRRKEDSDI